MRFFGACGRDGFGDAVTGSMAADGIDLSGVQRVDHPTGLALILVSDDGENQIVVLSGANDHVAAPRPDAAVDVWLTRAEVPVGAVAGTLEAARATERPGRSWCRRQAGRLPADRPAGSTW